MWRFEERKLERKKIDKKKMISKTCFSWLSMKILRGSKIKLLTNALLWTFLVFFFNENIKEIILKFL